MRLARVSPFFIFAITSFFLAPLADAESVVWNSSIPVTLYAYAKDFVNPDGTPSHLTGHSGYQSLEHILANVNYHIRVIDVQSAATLSSGATVPAGAQVAFEFIPHEDTDISWFGTGAWFGTPYGDWVPGAAPPVFTSTCFDKDLYATDGNGKYYAALAIDPPLKTILTPDSFSCTHTSLGETCTLPTPGSYVVSFNFAATNAHFYARTFSYYYSGYGCLGNNKPMSLSKDGEQPYTLSISQQSIPFILTVTAPQDDPATPEDESAPTAPTQPNIAASGAAACAVGQSFSLSFSSTDPEGDNLRYLVDWNGDGSVDEFVPGAGYVPSGTSLSASRAYATEGQKMVRVRAQDENGTLSPWASLTFSCRGSTEAGISGAGTNAGENGLLLPASPDLELRVLPSLVANGATTKVNWSARNVERCTVSGTNGDSWSGLRSSVGGESSGPITQPTFYTLSCVDREGAVHTKEAVVRVIPNWRER